MSAMFTWESIPTAVKVWVLALSVLTFALSLVVIPIVVVRMSPDYFMPQRELKQSWTNRHPAARWMALILKNLLGLILFFMGLLMLVGPGQGLLTILMSLVLMNFPGKRGFELWLIRRPAIRKSIDWMRHRAKRPPLELPPEPEGGEALEPNERI